MLALPKPVFLWTDIVLWVLFAALLAAILRPAAVTPLVAAVGVTSVAATVDYTMLLWRERDRSLKP